MFTIVGIQILVFVSDPIDPIVKSASVYQVCHFCRRRRQRAAAPGAASRWPTLLQALTPGLYVSTMNLDSAGRCLLRRNLNQLRSKILCNALCVLYYNFVCPSDILLGSTLASYVGGPGFDSHRGAWALGHFRIMCSLASLLSLAVK